MSKKKALLALALFAFSAVAAAIPPKHWICTGCKVYPDGSMTCETCWQV